MQNNSDNSGYPNFDTQSGQPQGFPQARPQSYQQGGPQEFQQPGPQYQQGYQPEGQGYQQPGAQGGFPMQRPQTYQPEGQGYQQPGPQGYQQPGYQQGYQPQPQGFQQPGPQGYQQPGYQPPNAYQQPGYQGPFPGQGFQPGPGNKVYQQGGMPDVNAVVVVGMGNQAEQMEMVSINTAISTNFGCYLCWLWFELIILVLGFISSCSYVGEAPAFTGNLIVQLVGIFIYGYAIQTYGKKQASSQSCVVTCFATLLVLTSIGFFIIVIFLFTLNASVNELQQECNEQYNDYNNDYCLDYDTAQALLDVLWFFVIVGVFIGLIPLCYVYSKSKELLKLFQRRDALLSVAGVPQ